MFYLMEVEFNSFYELGRSIIGDVPVYFEFVYVIFALVAALAFIAIILSFLGLIFRSFKRW